MKQLRLFIYILIIGFLFGCESETIPSASPNLVGDITTRGNNALASIPKDSPALFNTSLGTSIFIFDGNNWTGDQSIFPSSSTPPTTLTALYPAYNDNSLITENPYTSNGLKDVLIAQSSFTSEKDIELTFKHLFSKLTIHILSPLKESVTAITLQMPKIEKLNSNGTFSLSGVYQSIPELNEDGDYTFIIPPMENCSLILNFTIEEKVVSHTLTHTFKSGYKYECNVTNRKEPGIYNEDDWIEFSKKYNEIGADLSAYGKMQEDGRMLFRLFADLNFSDINHSDLLPIGYDPEKTSIIFTDIFDGQNHSISNLTIPDKKRNENVVKDISGLFGCIGTNGVVKNLHLENAHTIDNPICTNVGGIASRNEGTIQNCSVQNSTLTSASSGLVGGICASMANGYIINCKSTNNTITASTETRAGGIIGGSCGQILNCYTYNNSYSKENGGYIGGIAGSVSNSNSLVIANCYVKHLKALDVNWGAIIGLPQINKYTFDNLFYNGGNVIANDNTKFSTVSKYKEYCVEIEGEKKHISILLNNWIKTTGATNYKDFVFNNWIKSETSPYPAIFQ